MVRKGYSAVVGCQVAGSISRPSVNVPSRITFRDDGAGITINEILLTFHKY